MGRATLGASRSWTIPPHHAIPRHLTPPHAAQPLVRSSARAGNWKCNGTTESVAKLVKDLNAGSVPSEVDVVIAPTFMHLETVKQTLTNTSYKLSAQN